MADLPGLSLISPSNDAPQEPSSRTINLSAGTEWRFEVALEASLTVKLAPTSPSTGPQATAEIFGTELAANKPYTFPGGTKAAVYTWHGCSLEVSGSSESEYESDETQMNEYVNLHSALENLRIDAHQQKTSGPRVLVVGAEDAGKTTLVKTLVAYATRIGRSPMTINLDPSEGHLSLPGSLSTCVHGPGSLLDVEDECGGWGSSPISGPTAIPVSMPVAYEYGLANPDDNPALYKALATRLALAATSRFEEDADVKSTGFFVDTPGSLVQGKGGAELISHIVSEFSINIILVLGAERTYSDLLRRFSNPSSSTDQITTLKLARSGGSVDRDDKYMREIRQRQVRTYFYGSVKSHLDPFSRIVDAAELAIFKLMDADDADTQFLPGGGLDAADGTEASGTRLYERITTPSRAMDHSLLAITSASPMDPQEVIRDASLIGFLYIADVDEAKRKLRILAPSGGRLPANALIWASWPEGLGDLVA